MPNYLLRIVALLLVPALTMTSVPRAEAQGPRIGDIIMSRRSALWPRPYLFGTQALAVRPLSAVSGGHPGISRLLGVRSAAGLIALINGFPAMAANAAGPYFPAPDYAHIDLTGLLATVILVGFIRWWIHAKPGVARKWSWLTVATAILIAFYFYSTYQAYLFFNPLIEHAPQFVKPSFMAVSGLSALVAWALSQIIRKSMGKPDESRWKSLLLLLVLNVGYSAIVEGWAFDVALPQLPGIPGLAAPEMVQAFSDLFVFSPFFFEAAAFYAYSRFLMRKSQEDSVLEIRKHLVGFYAAYGWVWFIFVFLAMKGTDPLLGFRLINMGILFWNVAFETEKWPTSEQVLKWTGRHRPLFPLHVFLSGMQAFLNQRWLSAYLHRGIFLHYIASGLHDWIPLRFAPLELLAAACLWTGGQWFWNHWGAIGQTFKRILHPRRVTLILLLWLWLFGGVRAAAHERTPVGTAA